MSIKSNNKIKCPRCNGTGNIGHYKHVKGGVCFRCHGEGFITKPRKTSKKKAPIVAWTEIDIADLIGGVPFDDHTRGRKHAKELGITFFSYRSIRTMYQRGLKMTAQKWDGMRAKYKNALAKK